MKQVKLNKTVDEMLVEIAKQRTEEGKPVRTKQGIVEELIFKAHSREIKK